MIQKTWWTALVGLALVSAAHAQGPRKETVPLMCGGASHWAPPAASSYGAVIGGDEGTSEQSPCPNENGCSGPGCAVVKPLATGGVVGGVFTMGGTRTAVSKPAGPCRCAN